MQLFGRAKKAAAPSPKDSIVRLRETLEMLEKREKFLQGKIDNELKIAKANATKNKRRNNPLRFLADFFGSRFDGLEAQKSL
jgi:charged multivesicular body protein 4